MVAARMFCWRASSRGKRVRHVRARQPRVPVDLGACVVLCRVLLPASGACLRGAPVFRHEKGPQDASDGVGDGARRLRPPA